VVYYAIMLFGYMTSWFNKRLFFYLLVIILMLLAFFRFGIGLDYFAYEYLFNIIQPSISDEIKFGVEGKEIGFRIIAAISKELGLNYQQFLVIFAFINLFFVAKICKKYAINPTLSLIIFFCFYYITWVFSGIRQGLTIAVGLYYLLDCIEKNKTLKLIIISILLSTIHASALFLIVLYFLLKMDFSKRTLMLLSIISIIFSVLPTGSIVIKLASIPIIKEAMVYTDTSNSLNLLDYQGIARIILLVMAFVFYDYYVKQNEMSKNIIKLYILSFIIYFFFQFSELTAARLAIYGRYLEAIILGNVLYGFKEKINRLIYVFAILIICTLYLTKEMNAQINRIIVNAEIAPYVHIFNKDDYIFTRNIFISD